MAGDVLEELTIIWGWVKRHANGIVGDVLDISNGQRVKRYGRHQIALNWSNGSPHAVHTMSRLHAVDPNSEIGVDAALVLIQRANDAAEQFGGSAADILDKLAARLGVVEIQKIKHRHVESARAFIDSGGAGEEVSVDGYEPPTEPPPEAEAEPAGPPRDKRVGF